MKLSIRLGNIVTTYEDLCCNEQCAGKMEGVNHFGKCKECEIDVE
jgi:hypothetical protein